MQVPPFTFPTNRQTPRLSGFHFSLPTPPNPPFSASMPTFGSLLKKKKTKDSGGGQDQPTPKSPVKETFSNNNTFSSDSSKTAPSTANSQATTAVTSSSDPSSNADSMNRSSPPAKGPQIANLVNPTEGVVDSTPQSRQLKGKYTLTDFQIQRTLGTGSFGRVHLVQSKHNQRYYAVKVLKKQQVVKMKQIEHTNDERKMLQRVKHPFLITLWGTFQDSRNLYMVMDFIEGGELFSLLRKSQVCRRPMADIAPRFACANQRLSASRTQSRSSMLPKSHLLSNTFMCKISYIET